MKKLFINDIGFTLPFHLLGLVIIYGIAVYFLGTSVLFFLALQFIFMEIDFRIYHNTIQGKLEILNDVLDGGKI